MRDKEEDKLIILTFLLCSGWGYIVAFTKVLTVYSIYHTWIHHLHHSPLSFLDPIAGTISTDTIFPFTHMFTQYLHYIHLSMTFPLLPNSYLYILKWGKLKNRKKQLIDIQWPLLRNFRISEISRLEKRKDLSHQTEKVLKAINE
jgi:hypothetical protein